jgi:hypothetical protein
VDFGLLQPSVVFPSHNNFQPAACSAAVSVLGAAEFFWQQVVEQEKLTPAMTPRAVASANALKLIFLIFIF